MQQEVSPLELLKTGTEEEISIMSTQLAYEITKIYYDYYTKNEKSSINCNEYYILKKLGYNIDDKTIVILKEFILYVSDAINDKGIKDAIKLVKNKNSYIYVELAYYDYDISINRLNSELDKIHKNRNIDNVDIELYDEVFGKKYDCDVYDSAILIAKYIRDKQLEKKEIENKKVNKQNISSLSIKDSKTKVLALA